MSSESNEPVSRERPFDARPSDVSSRSFATIPATTGEVTPSISPAQLYANAKQTAGGGTHRVVLLAPPGAGKSTQAALLAERLKLTHLSAGALLRSQVALASSIGRAVAAALERGDLVPDDLLWAVVRPALDWAVVTGGYVLDDVPRNLPQAVALEEIAGVAPEIALSLEVSPQECRRRLLQRAQAERRVDDALAVIDRRLATFESDMAPVIAHYERAGVLVRIDGEGTAKEVAVRIAERLAS
ncbi:MAG: nucleoside monophosphate kinase [Acidimicrobiales bacterium]